MATVRSKCIDCDYRYAVGKSPRCNICRRRRTRDSGHGAHLKKAYGITIEDYYAMFDAQDGSCAICNGGTSRRFLACDHNHRTGEVRGLLCARCNKVLAAMGDDPARFHTAADYLVNPPSRQVLAARDTTAYADAKHGGQR